MATAKFIAALLALVSAASAQSSSLAARIQQVLDRPEFRHASFGIEFFDLDAARPIYRLNGDKLFTPASTTKLLTEGTALALLGADYRFHTRLYRTGPVNAGAIEGDLVLVAAGDPNLSGRIQPDGTLAFENEDHAYAGSPDTRAVPGDPLAVMRELAKQVAAAGITRITGRVLVDASLFREGARDLGTGIVISPIVVNDNIVDVTAGPGPSVGAPTTLRASPQSSYVTFINKSTTGAAGSRPSLRWANDVTNPDGSHTVTVTGTFPLGTPPILFAYPVPQPSRFAQVVLAEALRQAGIDVAIPRPENTPDFSTLAAFYTGPDVVAEHVSPPLGQEVKVTLKVSQNLHASMTPYVLGAVLGHAAADWDQAGFSLEHDFLQRAGLDLSSASQGDGAGGAPSAFFTPDFMVSYLAYMAKRPDFQVFYNALPILGRDGTLWNIQPASPAAGHVFAKTGTFGAFDALNHDVMVTGKGLAGYTTTIEGRHLAFAIYANHVSVPGDDPEATTRIVGQAVGEIAAIAYSTPAGPVK
ncbi:MAG: D-alanyl-D-alanine carboxypeptidase/D-alanyl-D-alanine-endopeptidase [Acidobacteria bacterium]|nr:D-alanyl-D-alanine carboxypeptidase/D-alanyl-D-alanine-endopeptidase [Acidobacteriota bacterium]